jgi:hypothetical protein
MTEKKSFALRIDKSILSSVEKWAADEFRSTNGQLEWIIYKALKDSKRLKIKGRLIQYWFEKCRLSIHEFSLGKDIILMQLSILAV